MDRRDFFKFLGIAGVAAGAGYLLYEYPPWLDYGTKSTEIRKPLERNGYMPSDVKEIIRYAILAASGHNTQPWKFSIRENEIEIRPDLSRRLAVVDPLDRELWISLGCALENLLIAGRACGYDVNVTYPQTEDSIRVRLGKGVEEKHPLFDAIPLRQNTRSVYDGQPVSTEILDRLAGMPGESGIKVSFLTNRTDLDKVVEYTNTGNLAQFKDRQFMTELMHWIRFNRKEALKTRDGLYSACSGNPEVPRWLGEIFLSTMGPQQQVDIDAKKLRSSSGVIIIASETEDKGAWVRTGQVYERLALLMTTFDIRSAFANQPIEVPGLRMEFQTALGLGSSLPQLLVRYGHAGLMPGSMRRPLEQVIGTS